MPLALGLSLFLHLNATNMQKQKLKKKNWHETYLHTSPKQVVEI
jgi:hypothetical protein